MSHKGMDCRICILYLFLAQSSKYADFTMAMLPSFSCSRGHDDDNDDDDDDTVH